jgi:hypothetical protein
MKILSTKVKRALCVASGKLRRRELDMSRCLRHQRRESDYDNSLMSWVSIDTRGKLMQC